MRLTTARYYTPSGRSIQAKGIEPDIIVEPAKIEQFKVNRVYEGDLRGALANPDDAEAAKKANPEGEEAEEEKSALDSNKEEISTEEIEDYQLSRAVDLVRGVALYESRLREEPMQMVEPEEEGEATTETEGAQ